MNDNSRLQQLKGIGKKRLGLKLKCEMHKSLDHDVMRGSVIIERTVSNI